MSNKAVFERITKRLRKVDDKFAEEFAKEFENKVKQRTPVDTGRLRAGWETKVTKSEIVIKNEVEYAGYVEDGTEYMEGAHMLKTTMREIPQISKRAQQKAKRRK